MIDDLAFPIAPRRGFLARMGVGAWALSMGAGTAAAAPWDASTREPDQWLGPLAGKHKQFFDATSVNDGFALVYAMNFLDSVVATYKVPDSDASAVIGFRHFSIPLAFTDELWAKYKLGEFTKLNDPQTKAPATRNYFNHPKAGDMPFMNASIDRLAARGVRFTVCNVALTLISGMLGGKIGVKAEDAKKEWTAHLIPGAVIAPSGVFAVNRAQEKGCTYCYAG